MFHKVLIEIAITSIIIAQVSSKYCQSVASICDCTYTHHDLFWNTHNIHCPKQVNGSDYEYTVKLIDTLSVQIECHNNSALSKLPVLNLNTHLYKVEFRNCFTNDKNSTNYRFELNQFLVRQLNVIIYKTINIVFSEPGQVEEGTFFTNLQVSNIWNLKVENVQFETSEVLHDCSNLRVVNFTNTKMANFDQLNQTGCDRMRIFIIRNTDTVKNLNRANMLKISKLQELKIYNSNIVDYYDEMFKDGALFDNSPLRYLVLDSVFNNYNEKILLNETLLKGVALFSLTLTNLKLEELPPKLLWEQRLIDILNLNKNQLVALDPGFFVNCDRLRIIDLSSNNFVKFSEVIFSNILSLSELHLSYNQLETFGIEIKTNASLNKIYLDHNYIQTINDTCPITGIRNPHGIIDLSYNLISKSRPIIDCLDSNTELKILDVSNNQIVDLDIQDALPYGRWGKFNTRLNFANNKITYIDFLSYNEGRPSSRTSEVNIHLDSNPVFCHNCLNMKKMFNTKVLHYAINTTSFRIHKPTECLSSTSCLISDLDKTIRCPSKCDCLYDEYTKTIIFDCENNNLDEVPYLNATDFIKLSIDKILLYLQYNKLTSISFANVSTEILDKLHTINLENNLIESVKFEPLEFPANISVLKLASNRISKFDEATMELLNSRKYLLSVTLANNPIVTDRDLFNNFTHLHKFKISDLAEIREETSMNATQHVEVKTDSGQDRSSSLGLLFGGLIMLFLVVIAGIIMMYTYRRYSGASIFHRLREQKAASEMMLGRFEDD